MKELDNILLDTNINSITKVYRIAKKLKVDNKINDQLWYAILEMKDDNIKNIMISSENEPHQSVKETSK